MGAYAVSVTLDFCYGHRIVGHKGRCAHLHGHNARVEIVCHGDLDELGMVVDFGEVRRILEAWILDHWDHRMILQREDPLLAALREAGEPVYVLGGPPTAENLAAHLHGVASAAGLPVRAIRFWEATGSMASYEPEA